jgi:hypothetical protein
MIDPSSSFCVAAAGSVGGVITGSAGAASGDCSRGPPHPVSAAIAAIVTVMGFNHRFECMI